MNFIRHALGSCRHLSKSVPKTETKRRKTATTLTKHYALIEKLFARLNVTESEKLLLQSYPNVLGKSSNCADSLYVLNKSLVAIITKHLSEDLRTEKAFVYELNPGPAVLTQAILEAGVSKLRVFEKRKDFYAHLKELKNLYQERLEIYEQDFFHLPKLDAHYQQSLLSLQDTIYKDVKVKNWIDEPTLKIVTAMPPAKEVNLLRYLVAKYCIIDLPFSLGRVELLIFISDKEFMRMTAQPEDKYHKYTSISVLYQILFDIECLHTEARSSFFPPTKEMDSMSMHLVRLTPKKHLFDLLPQTLLIDLSVFIRHHFKKRKDLVINALDNWIPGSSSRLKSEGVYETLQFGQLKPHQVLTLFLHFSSWPEYKDCLFKTLIKKYENEEDRFDDIEEAENE